MSRITEVSTHILSHWRIEIWNLEHVICVWRMHPITNYLPGSGPGTDLFEEIEFILIRLTYFKFGTHLTLCLNWYIDIGKTFFFRKVALEHTCYRLVYTKFRTICLLWHVEHIFFWEVDLWLIYLKHFLFLVWFTHNLIHR